MRRFDHVVLHVGSEAVLGTENRSERDLGIVEQAVGAVPQFRIHGCGIAYETDAAANDQVAMRLQEAFDAGDDCLAFHR